MHLVKEANSIIVQRLALQYLSPSLFREFITLQDACISGREIALRSGVPPDAQAWRYRIQHPDEGWSLTFRTVWRNGKLMAPLATHTTVEAYDEDNSSQLDEQECIRRANDWLCSLCL